MNSRSVQKFVRLLPFLLLASAVSVVVATQGGGSSKNTSDKSLVPASSSGLVATTSTPMATPRVTVNGKDVHLGPGGTADVTLPQPGGGTTHVVASGGQTQITTKSTNGLSSGRGPNGNNDNVSVSSQSSGSNGWSSTQAYGFSNNSNSNGNSSSFTSNQVFSTGSSNVEVTSP